MDGGRGRGLSMSSFVVAQKWKEAHTLDVLCWVHVSLCLLSYKDANKGSLSHKTPKRPRILSNNGRAFCLCLLRRDNLSPQTQAADFIANSTKMRAANANKPPYIHKRNLNPITSGFEFISRISIRRSWQTPLVAVGITRYHLVKPSSSSIHGSSWDLQWHHTTVGY